MTTQRQTAQTDSHIEALQNKNAVLQAYIDYVEGKTDIDELPMYFDQWKAFELEQDSPISKLF
jgi:hypothetical protein